ncbi:MAG: glycosyltransferase family 2 protein [Cyclobacteriaceae bacterium]|nr:glycosyltransferase family 2 protein [Cyclobacteriaceae bacterium]
MSVLSILVPVFNEQRTIAVVLGKIMDVTLEKNTSKEVIVIDDASTDETAATVKQFQLIHPSFELRYERHQVNQGKGAAVRTGIGLATGDFIIIQDADLEYDPQEYNVLLRPLLAGVADVVFGSRFMGGKPHRILFFWHSIGNKLLTFISNAFNDLNLTDMETGYKCFRRELIQKLLLKENRFGFEPEVTSKIARLKGISIYEVGISYYGRTYQEGKKINWRDGLRAIYVIVKYSLFDRQYLRPEPATKNPEAVAPGYL